MTASAALTLEQGLTALGSIVGPAHVNVSGEALRVDPADAPQVAEALRFAHSNRLVVTPTGGGTKSSWGNPVHADILLGLGRLNQLREHPWEDMTCTVEAGCTWSALQSNLAQHGQMVALDALWSERATVGGIVACNESGSLRLRYGALRDLVLGMTIVLADGTVAKTGGRVVKNVAGYDLHKLLIGSFGTLAVITEVNFRLHPALTSARTWTAAASDLAPLAEALKRMRNSQLAPSCLQLRVSSAWYQLDVRLVAPAECMDEHAARLESALAPLDLAESTEDVWRAREELFRNRSLVILKVSVPAGAICSPLRELVQASASSGVEVTSVAQATGLITVALGPINERIPALIEQLRRRATTLGGSAVVLQVPDALRDSIDVWGPEPSALSLMREIKRRFDPNRVLNPGRFVGGI